MNIPRFTDRTTRIIVISIGSKRLSANVRNPVLRPFIGGHFFDALQFKFEVLPVGIVGYWDFHLFHMTLSLIYPNSPGLILKRFTANLEFSAIYAMQCFFADIL